MNFEEAKATLIFIVLEPKVKEKMISILNLTAATAKMNIKYKDYCDKGRKI
jgi:hypothetical protein